jgi:hypothetical protein
VTGDAFCRTGHVAETERLVAFVHNPTELPLVTWVCAPGLAGDRPVTDLLSESDVGSLGPAHPLHLDVAARDTRVLLIGD